MLIILMTVMALVAGTGHGLHHVLGGAVAGTPLPSTPSAAAAASPAGSVAGTRGRYVSVAGSVTIHLTDDGFDPSSVQATNGHDLKVTLVNTGTRRHVFQSERLKVDVSLAPGERRSISIVSPPLGTFRVASDTPGDEHVSGTLIFYI